ncbi:hypothetical protein ATO12_23100 [Aquimarina atlantica]|uniref:SnoaL-like domain-containing protein n=1 Tax=Aquimarina atlantica TaxID=1317122 RepID=A0A023BRB3_9FLAO|nr:hypothetical protein [Aquimarina atlantica]EZH72343.1 hypothetical protein ATO12_23100 [Aquimarina atlantica]
MNKIIVVLFLVTIGFLSCKNTENETNKIEIARHYYKALDNSDGSLMKTLLTDSLLTKIPEYDYRQDYSKKEYLEKWLKWDSVFDPTYKILEIKQENGIVKAKISKIDKRIFFLQQKPFITNEILKFQNDKIIAIETEYVYFNEKVWGENLNTLLTWIAENHPELNGFLHDQTKSGGIKYLKAIELYNKK